MNVISLVSYPFLPAKTGGQKGIALFYKYFSRFHKVTIAGTKSNDNSELPGYELRKIFSVSPLRYVNLFTFFSIRKLIREKNASHLILEHPYFGWLGIALKNFCSVRLIVHSHNIESLRWKSLGKWWWRILWHYEKWTHKKADYNFFIQENDMQYAVDAFGLDPGKCITVPFGTEIAAPPGIVARSEAKKILCDQLQIPVDTKLLLFNGAFGYAPNRDALQDILYNVNPILHDRQLKYLMLIIGMDIPGTVAHSIFPDARILGYVDNLELYLTGSDVFLNPVISGGGIKTKLVEALAYNLNAVSSLNGAIGINPLLCNGKLMVCPDGDWHAFANAVEKAMLAFPDMPRAFYDHFYWEYIARKAADFVAS